MPDTSKDVAHARNTESGCEIYAFFSVDVGDRDRNFIGMVLCDTNSHSQTERWLKVIPHFAIKSIK